jgi:hypothetical protein
MGHHIVEGRNLYLRVTEPAKFVNTLIKNAETAMSRGFTVKVMFGGPEKFPTHTFEGKSIAAAKANIFIDSMAYWTRMMVDVKGKAHDENEAETEAVLKGIEGEVEPH